MRTRELVTWAALALLAWRVLHLESRLVLAEALTCQTGAASICQTVNVTLCRCAEPEANEANEGGNLPSSRGFPASGSTKEE